METNRLRNALVRDGRLPEVVNAMDALEESFVEDAPKKRTDEKKLLEDKSSLTPFPWGLIWPCQYRWPTLSSEVEDPGVEVIGSLYIA